MIPTGKSTHTLMKFKPLPSQERLKELFSYDKETGNFTSKTSRGRSKEGEIVGYVNDLGYRIIGIDYKSYPAHRLIWIYVTGEDPGELEIDHKNRNPSDNSWKNLRLATHSQNQWNTSYSGVSWNKALNKWRARIKVYGKSIYLGAFDCHWAAYEAVCDARIKHFGEFAPI